MTLHPLLHRVRTPIKLACARAGMIYPVLAPRGKPGTSSSHMCDDVAVAPSGMFTVIGSCSFCLFMHGASRIKKFPVAPVSRIAWRDGMPSVELLAFAATCLRNFRFSSLRSHFRAILFVGWSQTVVCTFPGTNNWVQLSLERC